MSTCEIYSQFGIIYISNNKKKLRSWKYRFGNTLIHNCCSSEIGKYKAWNETYSVNKRFGFQ